MTDFISCSQHTCSESKEWDEPHENGLYDG